MSREAPDFRSPLVLALSVAVPLELARLRQADDEQRAAYIARHTGQAVAAILGAHGDQLLYGGKHCAETFAATARGLACLAWQPGGVTFAGAHWCADHAECVEAERQAAARPLREPAPAEPVRRIVDVHLPEVTP